MVESAAGLQLPGPRKEQGNQELAAVVQPPTWVACFGQLYKAHTLDQTHGPKLVTGVWRQETGQKCPRNALPSATKRT